jgi:uracil-DNA glycosylase family 4
VSKAPHSTELEPALNCSKCARLAAFREANSNSHSDWFNGPVPSFGGADARLLIVGLAPGLKGANRTGRPFTGDYAGDLLYATLDKFGLSSGTYGGRADDGFALRDCMVTNAVRCVPPQNKPTGEEQANCRPFLAARLGSMPHLEAVLALGRIAHDAVLTTLELRKSEYPFAHARSHDLGQRFLLFDSYHCSRYNTNTGRLTASMFEEVFGQIRNHLA